MKTLDEYNKEKADQFNQNEINKSKTWVVCNECRTELVKTNPGVMLCTWPGKIEVHCPKCGYKGYLIV